jgi:hypothetical protein
MDPDIPQWQKDLIDLRLAEYNKNPDDALDWEDVSKEFDKEDEDDARAYDEAKKNDTGERIPMEDAFKIIEKQGC